MTRPTAAVVGAGAWGTTLALQLARRGPVTLLARDETTSATLAGSRENARHLPGIQLPVEVEATADPTAIADAHRAGRDGCARIRHPERG